MDPAVSPVQLKISGTSAVLLTRLVERMGTADRPIEPGAVLMSALGLLDLALKAKAEGKRLAFFDPASLEFSEVAF